MTSEMADGEINSFVRGKNGVSRADLLWALKTLHPDHHAQIVEILGFEKIQKTDQKKDRQDRFKSSGNLHQGKGSEAATDDQFSEPFVDPITSVATSSSYYRITSRAIDQARKHAETDRQALPDWYTSASSILLKETGTRVPKRHQVKPLHTELAVWSRLLSFLQKVLGDQVEGRKPDTAEMVKQVANGEMIRSIPREQRYNWSTKARLLIDINESNFPYQRDFLHLRDRLVQLRGDEGLEVQYIYDEPGGYIARYDQQREIIEPWRLPEQGIPVLILSDLAMHSQSRQSLYGWLVFGQILKAQGRRATVLMPVAERNMDYRLLKYFDCVVWDKTSRFKRVTEETCSNKDKQNHPETIDRLLAYFFAAVRVDSGLLRALRYSLPGHFDIGHEAAIWQHLAVVSEGDEWGWEAENKAGYLEQAQRLVTDLLPVQQQKLIELIGRYHALYPDELYFEAMYGLKILGLTLPDEVDAATEKFMQDMVATYRDNAHNILLHGWVKRHLARHEASAFRRKHEYWLPFLAFARMQDARLKGEAEIEWPGDLTQSEIESVLRYISQTQIHQPYLLRQEAEKLMLTSGHAVSPVTSHDNWEGYFQSGALVLKLWLEETSIFHIHEDGQGHQRIVSIELTQAENKVFRLPSTGQHAFQIGRERFAIDVIAAQQQKQDWVMFIGSGSKGLYAESVDNQDNVCRWYWHPPEWDSESGMLPGFWFYLPNDSASLKPDWAINAGRDQFGCYADAEIAGIIQRFRWIEPASFMMGSPDGEDGRDNDEIQHQVILTQGYWLADTTCTQALWQAVMREKPSRFEGAAKPVEGVTWNAIRDFLEQINTQHSELKLRLPTEAEWENACRAGTVMPFSFGEALSLDKVNYRGVWEYESDKWGEGALQQTAEVKSYPPNAWGLYEMHGNVWEWCQDWYGEYPSEPVTDPQGPDSAGGRVLRGGSWFGYGRRCRSAHRNLNDPSLRDLNAGFRLARGHALKPVRTVGAGQQPADSRAGGAHGGQAGDGLRSKGKLKTRR